MLYSVLILFQITPSFPFMKQPSFPNLNHLLHGTLFDFAFETFSLSADNKLFFDCHKPLCTLVIFWQIFFFAVVIPYGLPSFYEWFVNGLTDDKIALQSPCCERKQSYVLDKICNSLMWKNVLQTPPNPSTTLNLFSQTWNDEWTDKYRPTSM